MAVHYKDNQQMIKEIKKLMLDNDVSQRTIADKLNITPQGFTKLLSKKNFGFEDAERILKAMGYTLVVSFEEVSQ